MPDDLLVVGVNGDIIEVDSKVSSHFGLEDAYPNPFNPTTTMSFNIPYNSRVVIEVYNINGSNVATLSDQEYVSGYHSVTWNADSFSSGVYFVRMVAGSYMSTQRITLMK